MVLLHYISQGIPLGLLMVAIPAWLAVEGATPGEIGIYLSISGLPWALKLVNGFLMDRFAFLAMGRRRAWLLAAQLVMVAGMLTGAIVDPGPHDLTLLTAVCFAINVATTFQDVAVDGMAVDLVPEDERARANGFMFGGQALGVATSSAGGGTLLANFGLATTFILLAAVVAGVFVASVFARERPGERLLPWTEGAASAHAIAFKVDRWGPIFSGVWRSLRLPVSLCAIVVFFFSGAMSGLYSGLAPLMGAGLAGLDTAQISAIAGVNGVISGVLGIVVFGPFADRIGLHRAFAIAFLVPAAISTAMLVADGWWYIVYLVIGFSALIYASNIFGGVLVAAVGMRLCAPAVAATQFTIYMALGNLGNSFGSALLGPLNALGGFYGMIGGLVVLGLGGWLVLRLRPDIGSKQNDALAVREILGAEASQADAG